MSATRSELKKAITAASRARKRHQKGYHKCHERHKKAARLALTWEHEMKYHQFEVKKAEGQLEKAKEALAALPKGRRRKSS